jgi:two-component system nitrate/nitrite response regulator NarL
MQGSKIELLLRSRLVRDILSLVLMEAGFCVVHELVPGNSDTIAVIDFDDRGDQAVIRAHQERGGKIVVLAHGSDCREFDDDQIASLSGIITYSLSAEAFVRSLQLISSGERVFPQEVTLRSKPRTPLHETASPRSDVNRLSPREREILSHLIGGHSNKGIARFLGIAEATVKVHLKSLLRKIGMDNRTQAAIWALSNPAALTNIPRGFV